MSGNPRFVSAGAEHGEMVDPQSRLAYDLYEFVRKGVSVDSQGEGIPAPESASGLREQGTELWLDSGDVQEIDPVQSHAPVLSSLVGGLSTTHDLIEREVERGTYDDLIAQATHLMGNLTLPQRVTELIFMLHARHALRLAERYGCRINVELPAEKTPNQQMLIAYGRRMQEVCPERFVVKIPWTAAGLVAAAALQQEGVRVNIGPAFSARHSYLATAVTNPSYVTVMIGRLNTYVAENRLGDGSFLGEKMALASQREVNVFARGLPQSQTRQVASDVQDALEVELIAGVDVVAVPPRVGQQIWQQPTDSWRSRLHDDYEITLAPDVNPDAVQLHKLWNVSVEMRKLVEQLILRAPRSQEDLIQLAHRLALQDLFPQWTEEEETVLAAGGVIPRHSHWGARLMQGDVALDSLLASAARAATFQAQSSLGQRLRTRLAG